jgi:hypothetical protein
MTRLHPRYSPTTDRVLAAFVDARWRMLDAGLVAHLTGLGKDTIRHHAYLLLDVGHLRHTSYRGTWAITPQGRRRVAEVREGGAWCEAS